MLIVPLLILSFVHFSLGGTACNSSVIGINSQCPADQPYCVFITTNTTECRECKSNCDCDYNKYCSVNPETIGTCLDFTPYGITCYPYSAQQLTNANFSDTYKCAVLYTDANNTIFIDQQGVCAIQTCRYCDYQNGNGGLGTCNPTSGNKLERSCVYPGTLVNTHSMPWNAQQYYSTPENVWWAIFFVLFIVFIGVQATILFCQWRKGPSTKSGDLHPSSQVDSRDSKKHESAVESEKNSSKRSTAQHTEEGEQAPQPATDGYDSPPPTKPKNYSGPPSKRGSTHSTVDPDVIILSQTQE